MTTSLTTLQTTSKGGELQVTPRAKDPRLTVFMNSDLKRRLEKLSRHYDVETMKVFMVVESLGESNMHAVYNPLKKSNWQQFLQRLEACRVDHSKHEKTRLYYQHFLNEVRREDQGRQWFLAVLLLLHRFGATDMFNYLTTHSTTHHHNHHNHSDRNSPRRLESVGHSHGGNTLRSSKAPDTHPSQFHKNPFEIGVRGSLTSLHLSGSNNSSSNNSTSTSIHNSEFCNHLVRLFEKKMESWFDSFQAIAVRLTAHVKVSGLVRLLSGQVHALVTRKGKLTAVVIKVTQQETPRPLDVAELCLNKVMIIQNGLALPEELGLALLILHVHPARPVLRLWQYTPSAQMETAIRTADIDDMIDAGRLSVQHELFAETTTTDTMPPTDINGTDNANNGLNSL